MAKNKISSKSSLDEIYEYYSARYDKAQNKIKEEFGSDMYAKKTAREKFEIQLLGFREDNKKASVQTLVNKIVARQESPITIKQAKAFRNAEDEGDKHTLKEIRFNMEYKRLEIINSYNNMRKDGLSSYAASGLIANLYFGSD